MARSSVVVSSLLLVAAIGAVRSIPTGSNRIVGGEVADDTQMPYQVALFYDGRFRCGGSVVSARHVLTAAHCVVENGLVLEASLFTVHVGSANLNVGGHRHQVLEAHPHEKYVAGGHDIAMLVMEDVFTFDAYTQPIELMEDEVPVGSEVVISGYGRVGDGLPTSEALLYNTMYVVEDMFCKAMSVVWRSGLICFDKPGSNGACNGDSGGPAVYDGKLVGVANFIRESCGGDYPDGYAKVSFYVDWIRQFLE
ncbi:serine protease SP24D-like [Anopheles ziemanni]|uniref:serine protease SP24D-like n=1 Tax=Anopheles coustani TaxID=139045 RepID=UPI00265A5DDC|nr:serine protease SP24D-like [Anopheles coustani]XP_058167350.1 serine protease SP24D-like [Anopheles ziemanni]